MPITLPHRIALALAGSALFLAAPAQAAPKTNAATRILDQDAARRLRENKGLSLQWISWDQRGTATVAVDRRGRWRLRGEQKEAGGPGRLRLDGKVTEIGADYFLFDGTVRIDNAGDPGRHCEKSKVWRFGITQNRQYWRIREFEWCDDLTDYIDIYF